MTSEYGLCIGFPPQWSIEDPRVVLNLGWRHGISAATLAKIRGTRLKTHWLKSKVWPFDEHYQNLQN